MPTLTDIYSKSNLKGLPDYVQGLPIKRQHQWIDVWNSSFQRAKDDGQSDSDAESVAFRNANGVVVKPSGESAPGAQGQTRGQTKGQARALVETIFQKVLVCESDTEGPLKGYTKIRALVSEADRVNRNGRVYPLAVWEKNIPQMLEDLDQRPGAAFHPEGETEIPDVAIRWTKVQLEGKQLFAEGIIVPTRVGQDLDQCVRAGLAVGISSRGYGSVEPGVWEGQDADIIQPDYLCETFDAVIRPSSQDARILAYEGRRPPTEEPMPVNVEDLLQQLKDAPDHVWNEALDLLFDAKISTADKNDLPDSCFALVHTPVKDKAQDRALPYKHADGSIDADHVRNALARLNQVKGFSDEEKAAAKTKLQNALKSIGGHPGDDDTDKPEGRMEPTTNAAEQEAKGKPTATDPDGDGDDDTTAKGDTDHDYVEPDGSPGPKAKKMKAKKKAEDETPAEKPAEVVDETPAEATSGEEVEGKEDEAVASGAHVVKALLRGKDNVDSTDTGFIQPVQGLDADQDNTPDSADQDDKDESEDKPEAKNETRSEDTVEAKSDDQDDGDDDGEEPSDDNPKTRDDDAKQKKGANDESAKAPTTVLGEGLTTQIARLTEAAKSSEHLRNALKHLHNAVKAQMSEGKYYEAGHVAHMMDHLGGMCEDDMEAFTGIAKGLDAQAEAYVAQSGELNEARARVGLIDRMIEAAKEEKFAWATFVYLRENVTSDADFAPRLVEARKVVSLAMRESFKGPSGEPLREQDADLRTPEERRNAEVDLMYRLMREK